MTASDPNHESVTSRRTTGVWLPPAPVLIRIFHLMMAVTAALFTVVFTLQAVSVALDYRQFHRDPSSPPPNSPLGPVLKAAISFVAAIVLSRQMWRVFTGRWPPDKRPNATVTFDNISVTCRRPSGHVETVRWSDLKAVLVKTTSSGPWLDDVFFVLVGSNSGCVVPSESTGTDQFIQRLQRLPNFDNEKLIEAMRCTDDREILCWTRDQVTADCTESTG